MSKSVLKIWEREFELNVVYECYPGEEVLDSQRLALEQICTTNIIDAALDHVKAYVKNTAASQVELPIENIFKYVMPKSIYVPHNVKSSVIAIMCNYKFDAEHGIAVVFENGKYKEVGAQDIIL